MPLRIDQPTTTDASFSVLAMHDRVSAATAAYAAERYGGATPPRAALEVPVELPVAIESEPLTWASMPF